MPSSASIPDARVEPLSGGDDRVVRVERVGERWQCHSDVADLIRECGSDVESWGPPDTLKIIKHGPHRTVYQVSSPAGELFAKRYRVTSLGDRLLHLVRPSRAEREWNACRGLLDVGIPTTEPLAVGVVRQGVWVKESWLLTRGLPDVAQLDDVTEQLLATNTGTRAARRQLAAAIGTMIGAVHRNGFLHFDLHAGNVLVRREGNGFRAWLIDLHQLRHRKTVTADEAERNLALFDHFFVGRATPADRLAFFRNWWHAFQGIESRTCLDVSTQAQRMRCDAFRSMCRKVESSCREAEFEAFARRDRKWRRGNRRLIVADTEEVRCRGLALLGKETVAALRDRPSEVLGVPMSHLSSGSVEGSLTIDDQRVQVTIQAFDPPKGQASSEAASKDGPARTAWEMGHALLRRSIPAVRPLFFRESLRAGNEPTILITEPSSEAVLFSSRGSDFAALDGRVSRGMIEALGRVVRRLHARGFLHDELALANLWATPPLEARDSNPWSIQLDGLSHVRMVGTVTPSEAARQLALLDDSATSLPRIGNPDRLRFLRAYLGPVRVKDWKTWWRRIALAVRVSPASNARNPPRVETARAA